MAELPAGFVLEGDALPAGFQLEEQPQGLKGAITYGAQGAMRGLTGVLDIPGQLMNLATGREDQTLGQTVRQAIGSAQERVGALTGRSAPGTRYQYETIEDIPPEYRASARFGEAVGATYPMAAAPLIAARAVSMPAALAAQTAAPTATGLGPAASNAVRQMVATAAANPAFSVASQIPSTLGAGVGAYGAEVAFPGSELAQMAGQFGGGLLGAGLTAGAMGAGGAARGRVSAVLPGTEAAAKEQAGRALAPILEQAGETPAQIIQRLQRPDIVPGALPAELAQSRGIMGVQRYLAGQDTELANALAASRERVAAGIQAGVQEAFQPGSTQALTQAAQTRQRGFMQRIDNLATQAEKKGQALLARVAEEGAARVTGAQQRAATLGEQAAVAAEPIAPLSPGQARGANLQAYKLVEDAMTAGRKEERLLWSAAPKDVELPAVNIVQKYDELRSTMLPEDTMPSIVDRVMKRFKLSAPQEVLGETALEREARTFMAKRDGAGTKPITSGELLELRSILLDEARSLRAQSNFKDARRVGLLADAALEDLAQIGPSIQAARDFSLALNDRFSRSFAGDVLGTKPSGAPRIRPELTLEAATAGGPERAAAQLRELRTAVAEQGPAMQAIQQDFLRTLTERVLDPTTGAVIPRRADAFLRDNAAILEQFPQMRESIKRAAEAQRAAGAATEAITQVEKSVAAAMTQAQRTSEETVREVLKKTGDAAKQAEKAAAFARVLAAGERPEQAIASAIRSENPVRNLTKLSTLALRGGPDAVGGLRGAVLKNAMDDAMKGGEVNYGKLSQTLTDPISNRGESVLQVLQRNKIMTPEQRSQIELFIKRGIERDLADMTGVDVKEFGKIGGLVSQYLSRFFGAFGGAEANRLVGGSGAGPSLQAAQMGSELGKRVVTKLPADKVNQVMSQALKADTPQELIEILERAATYSPRGQIAMDPATRELIGALRAMMVAPGYEPERPPGGASAFRPEQLGRR